MEEKIKNIDKDPNLTPEQKEKAKEEARKESKKESKKVKKSIEAGKTTEWVDEKGNPIKPVTPGTYPAGSTPNYELVGTVTNPETGKVTHIFKPATSDKPATVWVDVNGKPVKPLAEGDNPAGQVPGYELVRTINTETGNVIHVFKPKAAVNPTEPGTPDSPRNPMNPVDPKSPSKPTTPVMPSAPGNSEMPQAPATAKAEAKSQAQLQNTGTKANAGLGALGLLGILSGFGLVSRKRKED